MKSSMRQTTEHVESKYSGEILDRLEKVKRNRLDEEPDVGYEKLFNKALEQKISHRRCLFYFSMGGAILLFAGLVLLVFLYRDVFVHSLGRSAALFATLVTTFLGLLHTLVKVVFDDRALESIRDKLTLI